MLPFMYRIVVYFLSFISLTVISPPLETAISPELEKIIEQLDWDMTRIGGQGRKARNRAVKKLICIGEKGAEEKERILVTAGRLLAHENPLVTTAAQDIFINLGALDSIDRYRQPYYLRYRVPLSNADLTYVMNQIKEGEYEGLEVISEFYPSAQDIRYLNYLIDLVRHETHPLLYIRLRVFSLYPPDPAERYYISLIRASVEEDFHIGEQTPTDEACK